MSISSVKVVIPAQNEEQAIGKVLSEIPDIVNEVIVVDNGSTDDTPKVARSHGATVISEPVPGYGRACLAGIKQAGACDIIVFLDGDASDYPAEIVDVIAPIMDETADMVIGSRVLGQREKGSLTLQQRWGNDLACTLIRLIWRHKYTDLGPFRAIRKTSLDIL